MKKISGLIILLFCAFFTFAQAPSFPNQNINNSNASTIFGYLGGLTSNGYKLKYFADTTAANAAPYLKFTPHLMIKAGNNIYVRSTDISRWLLVGGSGTTVPVTFIGIDSVTIVGNQLCQWSGGISTCYTITTTGPPTTTGIDSVTVFGDALCQWVGGTATCYTITNTIINNSQIINLIDSSITVNNFNTFGIDSTTRLITGSVIIDSGFIGHTTALFYKILGRYYNAVALDSFQITGSNPSADRYTSVVADTLGNIYLKDGLNGYPAAPPYIDPESEIELVRYFIPAGSTTPQGISSEYVYRDGINYWDNERGTTSTGYDSAYATTPFSIPNSLRLTAQVAGQYYRFGNGTTLNVSDYTFIDFYLRLAGTFNSNTKWGFQLYNDSVSVSNVVVLQNGVYGYDRTVINSYQPVALDMRDFNFTGALFNKIRVTAIGNGSTAYQIDDVKLQIGGANTGGGGTFVETVNNVGGANVLLKIGNILRLNADSSLYELVDSLSGTTLRVVPTFLKYLVSQDTCLVLDSIDAKRVGISGNPYCRGIKSVVAGTNITVDNTDPLNPIINSTASGTGGISTLGSPTYGLAKVNDSTYRVDSTEIGNKAYIDALSALKKDKADSVISTGYATQYDLTKTKDSLQANIDLKQNLITTSEQVATATASQTAFTFTSVPASYSDYIIFINGMIVKSTTDFTTSGNVVTLVIARDLNDTVIFRRTK